jgi:hypothetical protein
MTRWNCKYGTHFCGHFGDLCEKCMADLEAERAMKLAAAGATIASAPAFLDLSTLTTKQLEGLKDSVDGLLHTRARYPNHNAVSVEINVGGLRIKF